MEELRRTVDDGNDGVDAAVIVKIGERHAAMHGGALKFRAGAGGDVFETLASEVAKNTIGQCRIAAEVAIQLRKMREGEEQVFPAVVVEVVHAEAPAGKLARAHQQAGALRIVFEAGGAAEIAEQHERVIEDAGHHEVRLSIVIEIPKVGAHPGDGEAVLAQCHAGFESDLLKGSVALIAKEKIADRIVGHEDIGQPIAIDIARRRLPCLCRYGVRFRMFARHR